jgi:hypothetical protein
MVLDRARQHRNRECQMSNVVEFPHEPPPAPPTEEDRWTQVAFAGSAMVGMTPDKELRFLKSLHDQWLADIPEDHVVTDEELGSMKHAAVALKMLLWALITNREDPERAAKAAEFRRAKMLEFFEREGARVFDGGGIKKVFQARGGATAGGRQTHSESRAFEMFPS